MNLSKAWGIYELILKCTQMKTFINKISMEQIRTKNWFQGSHTLFITLYIQQINTNEAS